MNKINALFTALIRQGSESNDLIVDSVSSLADTWITVRHEELNRERIRSLFIIKSRGMGHSINLWDFIITNKGIQLLPSNVSTNQKQNGIDRTGINRKQGSKSSRKKEKIKPGYNRK